jgi:hypothetical protein
MDDITETRSSSFSSSDGNSPPDGNPSIPPVDNNNNNPPLDNNQQPSSKDYEDFKQKFKNEIKIVTKKLVKIK